VIVRQIRRDGNCFIRAFGFGLMNYLLEAPPAVKSAFRTRLETIRQALLDSGVEAFLVDDFYEV